MGIGLILGIAAAVTLLVVLCLSAVVSARRRNRRLMEDLTALRVRLEHVEGAVATDDPPDEPDYVITTAGLPAVVKPVVDVERQAQVDARQFASVAVGESLVRIASLAYGVRRALSAENRNRIGFEVKREIRRARRQRKRELKEARRHLRATQREEDAA